MPNPISISRRKAIAGLGMLGASSLARASVQDTAVTDSPPTEVLLSVQARKDATNQLLSYFKGTVPQLLRPSEGILLHPSIAPSLPGKQYSTSLWDWDTLWTTRGLFRYANITNDRPFHDRIVEHAIGSFNNFFDHQSEEGRLPIMIDITHADLFGCLQKASPNIHNQAKPVFGQLALLISDEQASAQWVAPHFDKLIRFYDSWVLGNQSNTGLFVWGDDVAIGNDNDPTTFGRPFFSSANLLLNCLFYQDLNAAAELATRLNRSPDASRLRQQTKSLGEAIQSLCWDPRDSFYYTADVQCVDRRRELIPSVKPGMDMSWQALPLRIQVFTGFLPLWCGLATPEQATALVHTNYLHDDRLRAEWGVRSLSLRETMYSMAFSSNPSNWLGPVWILVNYFVWKSLTNFGFRPEADALRDKTLLLLSNDLRSSGSLNEYYHPDTGAALSHPGFMDWNLLVMEMV
jgi:putative isomerase